VSAERKRHLIEQIIRLRRAEREAPTVRDIVAVRAALENELGPTVSQRVAATLLGVSHTALRRWVKAGDLPLVPTTSGRQEVPVSALLDLHERVTAAREAGRRHALEAPLSAGRERARTLRADELVADVDDADGHDRARRRSLAYHRALARRLRRQMVDDARHVVWKWRDQGRIDERYADQWEEVLTRPVSEVRRIISEDSSAGDDLRQNSPFAGMLSEAERRQIMQQVR
jgi:hypothetical protein